MVPLALLGQDWLSHNHVPPPKLKVFPTLNVYYRNEEGKKRTLTQESHVTPRLGEQSRKKNQSKSFYQPNPNPSASPVVCKAQGEPRGPSARPSME